MLLITCSVHFRDNFAQPDKSKSYHLSWIEIITNSLAWLVIELQPPIGLSRIKKKQINLQFCIYIS